MENRPGSPIKQPHITVATAPTFPKIVRGDYFLAVEYPKTRSEGIIFGVNRPIGDERCLIRFNIKKYFDGYFFGVPILGCNLEGVVLPVSPVSPVSLHY